MKSRGSNVVLHSALGMALVGAMSLTAGCASWFGGRTADETKPVTPVSTTPVVTEPVGMGSKMPPAEPKYTPPPPPETKSYVVKKGDTLGSIATRYGVTVSELVELNGLSNPNKIRVNQEIKIPAYAKDTGKKVSSAKKNGSAGSSKKAPGSAAGGAVATKKASGPAKEKVYTVQAGDTLASIAAANGTTVSALRQANNLVSDTVPPGTKLSIPAAKPASGKVETLPAGGAAPAPAPAPVPAPAGVGLGAPVPAPAPLAPIEQTPVVE